MKVLATTSADTTVNLWRPHAEGFAKISTLEGHSRWVWDAVFSSDGLYIVTGSSDCSCRVWEVATGEERLSIQGQHAVTLIALLDTGSSGDQYHSPREGDRFRRNDD